MNVLELLKNKTALYILGGIAAVGITAGTIYLSNSALLRAQLPDEAVQTQQQATSEANPSPPPAQPPASPAPSPEPLNPAEEIITCEMSGDTMVLSNNESISMKCTLNQEGYLSAMIVKDPFDPATAKQPQNLVKTVLAETGKEAKSYIVVWDGKNSYDQVTPPGEYNFVAAGRPTKLYDFDYSAHKFSLLDKLPAAEEHPAPESPGEEPPAVEPPAVETPSPAEPPPAEAPAPSPEPEQPSPVGEPSKCPGVNYPTDVDQGHWAYEIIRTGYDLCLFKGYSDGTFHPDQPITRFEASKMSLSAAAIQPTTGCYDNDCGTPFVDLDMNVNGWIRKAWELKIVQGYPGNIFLPHQTLTRAEATVIVAKAFGLALPTNCYTPNCGAGHPDNFFIDIFDFWQGPSIRALWDAGLIQGKAPFTFEPNSLITRSEMAKIIVKAAQIKKQ